MSRTTRRDFLAATAGLSLVSLAPELPRFLGASAHRTAASAAEAAPAAADRILVVVQLSGGNDGLNTVVPFRDERYRQARPTLAIAEADLLKLNDQLGLHPSLRGFAKLWESGQLAVVQGIGYPNPNRSHFESMDIWHTARLTPAGRSTGWLGRCLDTVPDRAGHRDARAIHVGGEVQPLALTATHSAAASLRSADELRFERGPEGDRWQAVWEASGASHATGGGGLLDFVRTVSSSALATSQQLERAKAKGNESGANYPATDLGGKLKTVGQLIDSGLATRIYYAQLDGFDTHATQPAAHAGLLTQVGDALAAFQDDLVRRGHANRVMTVVFSEFGRRVAENASQGTDHGAAAPLFVVGAATRGGIVGEHPSLGDLDDGDLKYHTDFRRLYSGLLSQWLSVPSRSVLGEDFEPLTVWS